LEQQQQNLKSQPPPNIQEQLAQNPQQMIPTLVNSVNMLMSNQSQNMFNNQSGFQNQQQNFPMHQQPPPHLQHDMGNQFLHMPPPNIPEMNYQFPEASRADVKFSFPDTSRPPPGFNNSSAESSPPPEISIEEPEPQPFFTLPAGLMLPLISLEDFSYKSLDPDRIKALPAMTAPPEKVLNAVEAYYSAPSHERPRDTEGWEKLGLYEYFKHKNAIRKQKEESIAKGFREKSKSPTPIPESLMKPVKKQKKRVYRSKSPETRASRSKSRSVTPEPPRPVITPTVNRNRGGRKRSRSPSPSPYRSFNRESRERVRKRSVTPPMNAFMGAAPKAATEFIDEGNKGHQMLKRLGWTSGGLGSGKTQGIVEPISGGEVRDRNELYKVNYRRKFHKR
jgi:calcium homeostasis endoplasmic reticulum protein